jgi:chromosome segregation ATPase
MGVLHFEVDAKAAALKKVETTAARQLREHEDAIALLRQQTGAAEVTIAEARAVAERERAQADVVQAETQRSVAQLQAVNREAEKELADRTADLTAKREALEAAEATIAQVEKAAQIERAALKETASTAAQDHAAEVQRLQRATDTAKRTLDSEKLSLDDRIRELEAELASLKKQTTVKMNTLQATLDDKQMEIDELNAKLKRSKTQVNSELADREDALGDLETK